LMFWKGLGLSGLPGPWKSVMVRPLRMLGFRSR
jgi:hypothetical protein